MKVFLRSALATAPMAQPTTPNDLPALGEPPSSVAARAFSGAFPDDGAGLLACLEAARGILASSQTQFNRLEAALDRPARDSSCRPMRAEAPFAAFEGRWRGRWGALPVEHLWRTVAPGVQLVVIRDGDAMKHGINLHRGSTVCGIVKAPGESYERFHRGRFVLGRRGASPELVWTTADRTYRERVVCTEAGRRYEIRELIGLGPDRRRGIEARYLPPEAGSLEGRASSKTARVAARSDQR